MSRNLTLLTVLLTMILLAGGCTGVSYQHLVSQKFFMHHTDKDRDTFWMTSFDNEDGAEDWTMRWWRCDGSSGVPKCVQVKFVKCQNEKECAIDGYYMSVDFLNTIP